MTVFPALQPAVRTFTPGRHPHSEIPTLSGLQTRVRASNVLLDQRLRLTFTALTEAEMLSIRSHYMDQQGRFLSFAIPDSLLRGMTAPANFTPANYSWIYAGAPQVEDIPGTQRYTVSVELVTVPPEGANVNGSEFTVYTALAAGTASTAAAATGAEFVVTASIEGGIVADNTSAGFDGTVTASMVSGTAAGEAGASDPNFSSVSLLLHMDGSNGSTLFPDSSPIAHTLTANGNAQVSTTSPKFGTGSLMLDGTGDDLSIPASTSLAFGTGTFTMEAFINTTAFQNCYLFGQRAFGGFHMGVLADGRFYGITPALNSIAEPSTSMVIGTWYHVAFTRDTSNVCRIFVNGTLRNSNTFAENGSATGVSYIGQTGLNDRYFNGRIDDLRITKGVCRYTATFTPPTAAFPDS